MSVEHERGQPPAREWPSVVRRALLSRRDRDVLGPRTLAERLNQEGRRARSAAVPSPALRKDADAVLEAVAFGQDSEAISRGRLLLERYKGDIAALGVSDDAARAMADTCLFVVRALLHRTDAEGARIQARECARLVPDFTMSADLHPPEVQALFVQVRSEAPQGKLTVHAETAKSSECLLRLQGRPVARLPATLDLVPGAYAVQAECEKPGIIRDVPVDPNAHRLLYTAPDLEASIRAEGAGLAYSTAPDLAERRAGLLLLLQWVGADELWTVERRSNAVDIRRWQREHDELVEVGERIVPALPVGTLDSRLQAAVSAIGCSRLPCQESRHETAASNQTGHTIAAVGAIGGTVAIAGSWLAFVRTVRSDTELSAMTYDDPAYGDELHTRDTFRSLALVSSTAGSALVAGSAFAWLPHAEGVPWWALAAGGGGVAAAGYGTMLWMQHGELETARCPDGEACLRPRSTVPLGPMLLTQGLALLSFPATYLVRSWASAPAGVELRASNAEVAVVVGGAL